MTTRILGSLATLAGLFFAGLASAAATAPDSTDPLVGVDRNRIAIIGDIVQSFQRDLDAGNLAEEADKLRARLAKLRADKLLAASLATSYGTLKSILDDAEKLAASVASAGASRAKALGDANKDLVYTPMAPCRMIDTRGFGAPIVGGPFAPNERRAYVPNGLCGLPLTGVSNLMITFTTQNLTPGSGGYLGIVGPGAPVSTTVDIFNIGQVWSASNVTVSTGPGGQFDVFVNTATANLVVDVLGYFAAPGGGVTGGTITLGPGLALSGGTLNLAPTQLLPTTACATNQIASWNGTAWACMTNSPSGGGTVTNIATGAGLTGGPITAAGIIGLSVAQTMPACSANQFPKWSGTAWVCGTSPSFVAYGGAVNAIAPASSAYVFVGPTTGSIAVVTTMHVTVYASSALGLTSGATQAAQFGICAQALPAGTVQLAGGTSNYASVQVTTTRSSVTSTNSFSGLAAGNYQFGMCVLNAGPAAIDNNGFLTGWLLLAS